MPRKAPREQAPADETVVDGPPPLSDRGQTLTSLDGRTGEGEPDGPSLPPGGKIGPYVLLSLIGSGGMGEVYAAYDRKLDRKIALKVLRGSRAPSEEARQRLVREARALANVSHPAIVSVYDADTVDDRVFVAMEFVRGRTLRQWLNERERKWSEVVELFEQLARGLAAIHEAGLIHRDFKPDNVLVDHRGRPRLIDFGLARRVDEPEDPVEVAEAMKEGQEIWTADLTRTGAVVGTPRYMAPEQFSQLAATPAVDQFAFCVTLYEAVYGRRPFRGQTLTELGESVLAGEVAEPPRSSAPRELLSVLRRGMRVAPADRWDGMEELAEILAQLVHTYAHEMEDAASASHRRKMAVLVVVALLLGPGFVSVAAALGWLAVDYANVLVGDVVALLAFHLILLVTRGWWLSQRVGRRFALLVSCITTTFLAQDLVGWFAGRAVEHSILANLVVGSLMLLFATPLLIPGVYLAGLLGVVLSVAALLDPAHSFLYLNGFSGGAVLICAFLAPRSRTASRIAAAASTSGVASSTNRP